MTDTDLVQMYADMVLEYAEEMLRLAEEVERLQLYATMLEWELVD